MDASGPRMSLSRRLLSLPQELPGTSLPPKVSGRRLGCVVLCVDHILESAVSSRRLPPVSVVRVRWWGEDSPGSLFRPALLTDRVRAANDDAPHRAIAMKYPVMVSPASLVEYFQDMQQLQLEVIDRSTRKKIGESSLSLTLQSGNAVMTAEEKLVALRRDSVLSEIRSTESGEAEDEVLGYLAVSFDVQCTNYEVEKPPMAVELKEDEVEMSPTESEWTKVLFSGSDIDVISMDSMVETERPQSSLHSAEVKTASLPSPFALAPSTTVNKEPNQTSPEVRKGLKIRGPIDSDARVRRLLEKGKVLQQSMEQAVRAMDDDAVGESSTIDENPTVNQTRKGMVRLDYPDFPVLESEEDANTFPVLSGFRDTSQCEGVKPVKEGLTRDKLIQKAQLLAKPVAPSSITLRGSEPLQFALMFESIWVINDVKYSHGSARLDVRLPRHNAVNMGSEQPHEYKLAGEAAVNVHYTVPSHFSNQLSPIRSRLERTIRRKLEISSWFGRSSQLRADLGGVAHVFATTFSHDAGDYFSGAFLIAEVWNDTFRNSDRTLVGLSRLPLRNFSSFFRARKTSMHKFCEQLLPFTGVDDCLPVTNPFTGQVAGYLRVCASIGTTEQLHTWASTTRAVIKLQSVVRGMLYRKRFGVYPIIRVAALTPHTLYSPVIRTPTSSLGRSGSSLSSQDPTKIVSDEIGLATSDPATNETGKLTGSEGLEYCTSKASHCHNDHCENGFNDLKSEHGSANKCEAREQEAEELVVPQNMQLQKNKLQHCSAELLSSVAHEEKAIQATSNVAHEEKAIQATSNVVAHEEKAIQATVNVAHEEKAIQATVNVAHEEKAIQATVNVAHEEKAIQATVNVAHDEKAIQATVNVAHEDKAIQATSNVVAHEEKAIQATVNVAHEEKAIQAYSFALDTSDDAVDIGVAVPRSDRWCYDDFGNHVDRHVILRTNGIQTSDNDGKQALVQRKDLLAADGATQDDDEDQKSSSGDSNESTSDVLHEFSRSLKTSSALQRQILELVHDILLEIRSEYPRNGAALPQGKSVIVTDSHARVAVETNVAPDQPNKVLEAQRKKSCSFKPRADSIKPEGENESVASTMRVEFVSTQSATNSGSALPIANTYFAKNEATNCRCARRDERDIYLTGMSLSCSSSKNNTSSTNSLFSHDSETERIAKIMQGSLRYWLNDADCVEDDSDESEDDRYF